MRATISSALQVSSVLRNRPHNHPSDLQQRLDIVADHRDNGHPQFWGRITGSEADAEKMYDELVELMYKHSR